eukprot:263588-Alexandrium_andersonii.AAC.1
MWWAWGRPPAGLRNAKQNLKMKSEALDQRATDLDMDKEEAQSKVGDLEKRAKEAQTTVFPIAP